MGKQTSLVPFLCIVLLLSVAAGAHAQDGPWSRLRGRISNFLSRTADALERDIARNNKNTTTTPTGPRGNTTRNPSQRASGKTPGKGENANPSGVKNPARLPQNPTKSTGNAFPVASLQQSQCQATGQITAVWCREDANGALQDIAYLNSASGLQQTGCSGNTDFNTYSKVMFLDQGESIISVRACSTDRDGYTAVTFITDGDQQFTCGTGTARANGSGGNDETSDNDNEWKIQAVARKLNNTVINGRTGETMRLEFVDSTSDNDADRERDSRQDSDDADADSDSADVSRRSDNDDEADSEPVSRQSRRASRREARRQARAAAARSRQSHIPARLRRYMADPDVPEARTAASSNYNGHPARSLLQAQPAAGLRPMPRATAAGTRANASAPAAGAAAAEPATWWWFDWGHGGGNQPQPGSGCQLFTPDKLPIWATASLRAPGASSSSANDTKTFAKVGSGAEAYIAFGNKRYFKDFNTYSQQLASFKAQPTALGFEPAWFFDQVDPLAGLNLQCNNGIANKVSSLCWDTNFTPTPTPWGVNNIMTMTFEATSSIGRAAPLTCPKTPGEIQTLVRGLQTFGQQLAGASNGVVGSVAWQRYTPAKCVEASMDRNTTITLQATFAPAPGRFLLGVGFWLLHNTPQDFCDMTYNGQSVCENTNVYSAAHSISLVIGEEAKQQKLAEIKKVQDLQSAAQQVQIASLQAKEVQIEQQLAQLQQQKQQQKPQPQAA